MSRPPGDRGGPPPGVGGTASRLASPRPLPRAGFAVDPVRLQHWAGMERRCGHPIWAARDDLGELGLGGSKLRKLDLILGRAIAEGATTILTHGTAQSNHCRLTAAATARLGLDCVLFLRGAPPRRYGGNEMLDRLFGARLVYTSDRDDSDVIQEMHAYAGVIAERRQRACIIPLGGATAEGTAAHTQALFDLARECERQHLVPEAIVVAVGSGSTFAGLRLGAEHYLPHTRVIGVSVSWSEDRVVAAALRLAHRAGQALGLPSRLKGGDFEVLTHYIGAGYTVPTRGAKQALVSVARTEGVLLDLTYTGKAFHAVMEMARSKTFRGPLLFWHTGGHPELFGRPASDLGLGAVRGEDRGRAIDPQAGNGRTRTPSPSR